MPKMGDAMEEGTLLSWQKQDGEAVKAGEVIARDRDGQKQRRDRSRGRRRPAHSGAARRGRSRRQGHRHHRRCRACRQWHIGERLGHEGTVTDQARTNGSKPESDGDAAGNSLTVHGGEGTQFKMDNADDKDIAHLSPQVHSHEETGKTESMTYADAIRMALQEELDRDEKVFLLGEEIGQYQGTFKITKDFLQKYGPERIVDTPISEAGMVGMTCGAAMMGMRPVIEFMTLNFALVAWDGIINHTAKILYMSGGQFNVPCVLRGPGGVGVQLSAQHSQDLAHWYANTPGLKVVVPATPADAKGLLKSAIRDNNPVVFTEHAGLYRTKGDVPTDPELYCSHRRRRHQARR